MDYEQAIKIAAAAPAGSWYHQEAWRVIRAHAGDRPPRALGIDSGLGYEELNDDDGDGL
jgi:hypothetical protein